MSERITFLEGNSSSSERIKDSNSSQDSATESLNSLIKTKETSCIETCLNTSENGEGERSRRKIFCSPLSQCLCGVVLILVSIGSLIFTPLDLMLWEKLNMRPGMPPYEWWTDPPDEVKLRVYVFNVTNHERFLQGIDEKLNVQEIGPIVYLEKLLHYNIHFNENSTMTYTAKRFPIYLPEENNVDMNATLIVPNIGVLGIFSYLHDANYFVRTLVRSFVSMKQSKPFVKKTVYEYLWNFTDPVLDTSRSLVPGLVPVDNAGMLARVYADFTDEVTVKIGQKWGHKEFFQIDRFRGEPQLPGYDPNARWFQNGEHTYFYNIIVTLMTRIGTFQECPDRIFGSTEGVMYAQHMTKQDVLLYWRKTVCKLMPLYFDDELSIDMVPIYRYNLSESVFERMKNETDCYDTEPSLEPGLSDASKCYFDMPMVASFPHFYTGNIPKDQYVTGLNPDRSKHNSWVKLEPYTGTPFESVARMQSNLRMHDISGYNEQFAKLSNLIIPLFWAEYHQEGLPDHIRNTIFFMIVILPPLSIIVSTTMLLFGFYLIIKYLFKNNLKNTLKNILRFKTKNVAQNKIFTFEKETFLKSS